MRPASAAFHAAVRSSHRVAVEVTVHSPDGTVTDLEVIDGTVTLESQAAIRGRCDLTVQGIDWVPTDPLDRLAPYGAELEIRRGVYLPNGTVETVALGWFGIEEVTVTDSGDGLQVQIAGLDRANRMQVARFEDSFELAAGTKFADGILNVGQGGWPDMPYQPNFTDVTSVTVGRIVAAQAGDDRWEFMQGLATALGMVLFFDGDGKLTMRPYADAGVVLEVAEGEVLIDVSRQWTRTDAFNRVIATGESTAGTQVYRGVATDDNPNSPTYYGGPFGKAPKFYENPDIGSDDIAAVAANAMLAQQLGVPSTISFTMVPNPALEPEDTILVRRDRLGIDAEHIVDSVSIGLGADQSMVCQTRERLVR